MTQKPLQAAAPGAGPGEGTEAAHVPDPAARAPTQPELLREPTARAGWVHTAHPGADVRPRSPTSPSPAAPPRLLRGPSSRE